MERALVTGGAGFIGSNLARELDERGIDVTVLDSMFLGSEDNLEGTDVELVEGSVLDGEKVEEAVEDVDVVFHHAARSSSPMHQEDPAMGARVNVEGFVNVAEAAIEAGVQKIVYASTSSMYGTVEPPHSVEQDPEPKNRYTASKMSREMYGRMYSYRDEIETTGLRYFSVYGPRERAKGKYANVVTQFLWRMQEGDRPVIWGDGEQERDFVYVGDVVRANLAAAETDKTLDGEVVNVGTGDPKSFNTVVERLNEELGTDIEPEHVENPRGDNYVRRHRAELERTRELLGWEPEVPFEEGVRKLVEYYS